MKVVARLASVMLAALLVFLPTVARTQTVAPISSSQLQNLGQLEDAISAYYKSGNYDKELEPIFADATAYLDQRVQARVKKPALVLDIDDTALSTVPYELKYSFGYDPKIWTAFAVNPGFPAIAPTLALVNHAKSLGVAVFFITGRRVPQTALTAKNLAKVGYTYTHLYLRPIADHAKSAIPFKSGQRSAIEKLGYTVIETVGDQWSDLEGGHAEREYKLPNPMYFIP